MPLTPALAEAGRCEFKGSLVLRVSSRTAREILPRKTKRRKKLRYGKRTPTVSILNRNAILHPPREMTLDLKTDSNISCVARAGV